MFVKNIFAEDINSYLPTFFWVDEFVNKYSKYT